MEPPLTQIPECYSARELAADQRANSLIWHDSIGSKSGAEQHIRRGRAGDTVRVPRRQLLAVRLHRGDDIALGSILAEVSA